MISLLFTIGSKGRDFLGKVSLGGLFQDIASLFEEFYEMIYICES